MLRNGNTAAYKWIAILGVLEGSFTSSLLTSSFPCEPFLVGLPGSEVASLTSEMLGLLPLVPRWLNWTLRRDLAILVAHKPVKRGYASLNRLLRLPWASFLLRRFLTRRELGILASSVVCLIVMSAKLARWVNRGLDSSLVGISKLDVTGVCWIQTTTTTIQPCALVDAQGLNCSDVIFNEMRSR